MFVCELCGTKRRLATLSEPERNDLTIFTIQDIELFRVTKIIFCEDCAYETSWTLDELEDKYKYKIETFWDIEYQLAVEHRNISLEDYINGPEINYPKYRVEPDS